MILFIGDGMGVSTITATRVYSVGVDGQLVMDQFPNYRQEAAVPFGSETHSAEEVAIYAIGAGSEMVRGTVKNTFIHRVMSKALGF